jgi:hypothetical protein
MLSSLRRLLPTNRHRPRATRRPFRHRPGVEPLEDRVVPYVLSGYQWANLNVSASFMPDGTLINGTTPSNLFATYNATYPTPTWQLQFARALQTWANSSNLNFHFVSDDGSPETVAGQAQGDPRFGDIRFGGYNMGSGIMGTGWNPSTTTTGGDVALNTNYTLQMGAMPDLYSVLLHEIGHGIGFNHSLVDPAVMEGGLWGVYPGIYPDDIAGDQAMYGARQADAYDGKSSNDTLATATPLTLSYGAIGTTADITTMTDVDNYSVVVPTGSDGTLTVSVDARNLSLFEPKLSIYDSSGALVTTASAATYGDVATVNLSGLAAGKTYYLQAAGATTDVFGMGAYQLNVNFGGFTPPPGPAPDRYEANDTVSTATNFGTLTSLSQTDLTLHSSTDVDYYTFTAGSKGTFSVSVTPTQGSGTLGLTVLNAKQTVLASGQSSTGAVSESVTLASGQQYYIKVTSPTGSLFTYNVSVGKSGGGGGGGKPLKLEMADVFYQNAADDPENAAPSGLVSRLSHTQSSDAAMGTEARVDVALRAAAGALQNGTANRLINQTISFEQTNAAILGNVALNQPAPVTFNRGAALGEGETLALGNFSTLVTPTVRMPAERSGNRAGLDGLFDEDQEDTSEWIYLLRYFASDREAEQDSGAVLAGDEACAGWHLTGDAYFAQENWDGNGAAGEPAVSPMMTAGLAAALIGFVSTPPEWFSARNRRPVGCDSNRDV